MCLERTKSVRSCQPGYLYIGTQHTIKKSNFHAFSHKNSINQPIIIMTTNTDPPHITTTVTHTGAITCRYTGRPVEIITMVPASEAHKYHKPTTRSDTTRNDKYGINSKDIKSKNSNLEKE